MEVVTASGPDPPKQWNEQKSQPEWPHRPKSASKNEPRHRSGKQGVAVPFSGGGLFKNGLLKDGMQPKRNC